MRRWGLIRSLFAILFIAGPAVDRAAAREIPSVQKPVIMHPHWQRLTRNVESVVSGGRYLALTDIEGAISLFDKQTGNREPLTPPDCVGRLKAVGFGGPWLAISCTAPGVDQADLYDVSSGTWVQQQISPAICDSNSEVLCEVDGVGTTWIRFFAILIGGGETHPGYVGYLQNIATGTVATDPADRPGSQDDLNTPSGVGRPCRRLRSSAFAQTYGSFGPLAGVMSYWHSAGRFVLTTGVDDTYTDAAPPPDHLYGCTTSLDLRLPYSTLASPRVFVHQEGGYQNFGTTISELPLVGRFLPSLRQFIVLKPKGSVVALTNTTLYTIATGGLWAATLSRPGR